MRRKSTRIVHSRISDRAVARARRARATSPASFFSQAAPPKHALCRRAFFLGRYANAIKLSPIDQLIQNAQASNPFSLPNYWEAGANRRGWYSKAGEPFTGNSY